MNPQDYDKAAMDAAREITGPISSRWDPFYIAAKQKKILADTAIIKTIAQAPLVAEIGQLKNDNTRLEDMLSDLRAKLAAAETWRTEATAQLIQCGKDLNSGHFKIDALRAQLAAVQSCLKQELVKLAAAREVIAKKDEALREAANARVLVAGDDDGGFGSQDESVPTEAAKLAIKALALTLLAGGGTEPVTHLNKAIDAVTYLCNRKPREQRPITISEREPDDVAQRIPLYGADGDAPTVTPASKEDAS